MFGHDIRHAKNLKVTTGEDGEKRLRSEDAEYVERTRQEVHNDDTPLDVLMLRSR